MVPALLSSNLCSIRGDEERLAFSVIWEMTPAAEIVKVDITKSVILSKVMPLGDMMLFAYQRYHSEY